MNSELEQQFSPEVLDALHEAIGDGINHIISIYVDDMPNSLQVMRQALAKQEYETIGRTAHSLKSSSGNLGATQLVTLSLELEMLIKSGCTQEAEISQSIQKIEAAFKQVQPRLLGYIR